MPKPIIVCWMLLIFIITPALAVAGVREDFETGLAFGKKGDYDTAIKLFTRVIQSGQLSKSNLSTAYHNRGYSWYLKKNYQKAIADLDTALRLNPNRPDSHSLRSRAFEKIGMLERALSDMEQYIKVKPQDTRGLKRFGRLQAMLDARGGSADRSVRSNGDQAGQTKPAKYAYYLIGKTNSMAGSRIAILADSKDWTALRACVTRQGGKIIAIVGAEALTALRKGVIDATITTRALLPRALDYLEGYQVVGISCTPSPTASLHPRSRPFKTMDESSRGSPSKSANAVTSEERFTIVDDGVIRDIRTNLEWLVGPDIDTNRIDAIYWVKSQRVGGGGWRMPFTEELHALYQPGVGSRNMSLMFKTTGWCIWTGENTGGTNAVTYYDFQSGRSDDIAENWSRGCRAFAVRAKR